MAVSSDTIEKIKSLPVSTILEAEGVFLKRVGREYVTHCLWHEDSNPSLTISDDKGFVFCHVCQAHNDAIGFIQKKYGITFRESCERIASVNNINMVFVDEDEEAYKKKRDQIQKELKNVQKVQENYRSNLKTSQIAIDFIVARGIKPEVSRYFGLGFDIIEQRLTIPVQDYKGNIVGFTARAINDEVKPKYKNTQNNLVFNKSTLVFNEYNASDQIREQDECIFVEGHIDVITLWQNGVKNVVALQGTASPSFEVIKRLTRKTNRFVLCMDSDTGGQLAVSKFLEAVQSFTLSGELEVRIATLPVGMDPDDFIKSGGDIKEVIVDALPWLDWILDKWLNDLNFNDKIKIQKVETSIRELFSKIQSPALRAHYYDKASIRLAQNKQALAAEIAKSFHEHQVDQKLKSKWDVPDIEFTRKLVEKRAIRLYIHNPEYRWVLKPLFDDLKFANMIWLWNRIKEVESYSQDGLCVDALMAVLAVAEPQYLQQLRPILVPTININDNELQIAHIEDIMTHDSIDVDLAI